MEKRSLRVAQTAHQLNPGATTDRSTGRPIGVSWVYMHNVTAFSRCNSRARCSRGRVLSAPEDRIYRNSISRDNGEPATTINGDSSGREGEAGSRTFYGENARLTSREHCVPPNEKDAGMYYRSLACLLVRRVHRRYVILMFESNRRRLLALRSSFCLFVSLSLSLFFLTSRRRSRRNGSNLTFLHGVFASAFND